MIKVYETEEALALTIAREMREQIEKKANPVFCLAAGSTASKCYKKFAEECGNSEAIKKLSFVSLDEWVGTGSETIGSCYQMLREDLFQYLPLSKEKIIFFDTVNNNLAEECKRIDTYIKEKPITFSLMGVGMNGHIGLNEPGAPIKDHSSIVPLSDTTKRVSQKYFAESTPVEEGITLGLQQIINSERVLVVVTGSHKKDIIKEILENPKAHLPAQELLGYEHIDFYIDKDAAQLIRQEFCK
ncbi:6-phosphogluconolactonase [Anaerotaenia torta]|uniref:6-phosphogluconolactonase n=1 Tax=Anaerotaenia torta TaxID=433293 RepID=UPI003D21BA77